MSGRTARRDEPRTLRTVTLPVAAQTFAVPADARLETLAAGRTALMAVATSVTGTMSAANPAAFHFLPPARLPSSPCCLRRHRLPRRARTGHSPREQSPSGLRSQNSRGKDRAKILSEIHSDILRTRRSSRHDSAGRQSISSPISLSFLSPLEPEDAEAGYFLFLPAVSVLTLNSGGRGGLALTKCPRPPHCPQVPPCWTQMSQLQVLRPLQWLQNPTPPTSFVTLIFSPFPPKPPPCPFRRARDRSSPPAEKLRSPRSPDHYKPGKSRASLSPWDRIRKLHRRNS